MPLPVTNRAEEPVMKRFAFALFAISVALVLYACRGGSSDASAADGGGACGSDTDDPPLSIACTGLYTDVPSKALAVSARAYAPSTPLWSDGAAKVRYIALPDGTQIDNTDANEWNFPVGTRAWKEFSREGKRIETRYFHKQSPGYWVYTTYVWNADESDATRGAGGPITLPSGEIYQVPTKDECTQCHRGRTDRLLGFEQVSLGLPGATGYALSSLVQDGKLTVLPAHTSLTIGDDGTGKAAPALAWLHVNCGTSCHNENSNAVAFPAGMRLRLDANALDGRSSNDFDARKTTIGVTVNTPQWSGDTRIVSGDPANSLLVALVSKRDADDQMPPIASSEIDHDGVAALTAWIGKMPLAAPAADAGVDAAMEAGANATDSGADSGEDQDGSTAEAGDTE